MSYFTLKDGQRLYYEDKGHGSDTLITMETLASDLQEIIQGLSLSNVTLLGWSMGAGVVS